MITEPKSVWAFKYTDLPFYLQHTLPAFPHKKLEFKDPDAFEADPWRTFTTSTSIYYLGKTSLEFQIVDKVPFGGFAETERPSKKRKIMEDEE